MARFFRTAPGRRLRGASAGWGASRSCLGDAGRLRDCVCSESPDPRANEIRGAGDQSPGANPTVDPSEARTFSASPTANPAGRRKRRLAGSEAHLPVLAVLALLSASEAWAASGGAGTGGGSSAGGSARIKIARSGGVGVGAPPPGVSTPSRPIVSGYKAKIVDGVAYAPSEAPLAVQRAIWAGNQIHTKPYIAVHYASLAWLWPGYDCSGSVSYVLYKAGLLSSSPDVSGDSRPGGGAVPVSGSRSGDRAPTRSWRSPGSCSTPLSTHL